MVKKKILHIAAVFAVALSSLQSVPLTVWAAADTCTWTGAVDTSWSTGGNWTGCDNAGVPENSDSLMFPAVAANKTTSNDLVGLSVADITVSGTGYTLDGNAFTISGVNALDSSESVTINADITYTAFNVTLRATTGKTITVAGVTNFSSGGGEVNVGTSGGYDGTVDFTGNVVGSAATQFIATNGATAVVRGATNTYTATTVGAESAGHFVCRSATCFGAAANDIYMGGGMVDIYTAGSYSNDIQTSAVTPGTSGLWAYEDVTLSGATTINDSLYFAEGSNGKTLQVNGNVSMVDEDLQISGASIDATTEINGNISGAHGVFAFSSTLVLAGTNTYTGGTSATSGNTAIVVTNPSGLGDSASGTFIGAGDTLAFDFAAPQTVAEQLNISGNGYAGSGAIVLFGQNTTLTGAMTLSGDATIATDSSSGDDLFLSGVISGAHNLTLVGTNGHAGGDIQITGASANTYTGATTVRGVRVYPAKAANVVAIPSNLVIDGTALDAGQVETSFSESIADSATVQLTSGATGAGLFIGGNATETIASFSGDGDVAIGEGATLITTSNSNFTFSGVIGKFLSGGGGPAYYRHTGTGTMTLSGEVETSAYGSNRPELVVSGGGTVVATGTTFEGVDITVQSGSTLKGTSTVGAVSAQNGATVAVGTSPGCMTFSSLTLAAGSTYQQEITGATACSQYDRAVVNGAVDLGGATLQVNQLAGFTPAQNLVFTVIDGTSLTGTFAGLSNGAVFDVNGVKYRINYNATGEVTLTVVNSAVTATTPTSTLANTGSPLLFIAASSAALIVGASVALGLRRRAIVPVNIDRK